MKYCAIIIICLVTYIAFSIHKLRQYSSDKILNELVAWSVTDNSSVYRCNLPLYSYINNAQLDLNIADECRITGEQEWDIVKEILTIFQEELIQDYFKGSLKPVRSKYSVPGDHYFMFALASFLAEHECDYLFHGHNMHEETISYKGHGYWGTKLFDATYSLTDFALVYHKMYYISYLFCNQSRIFNPKGTSFHDADDIKTTIVTKQISISRM